MDSEELSFSVEGENFRHDYSSIGIKEIALEQFRRCAISGSKDLMETTRHGQYPNAESFFGSVDMLGAILASHFEMKGRDKKFLYQDLIDRITKCYDDLGGIQGNRNELVKELNSKVAVSQKKGVPRGGNGYGIEKYNKDILSLSVTTTKQKIEVYKRVLAILSTLLHRLNYFTEGGITG